MVYSFKRQSAAFLLVMLVTGGLLSPVVHQFQHAHQAHSAEQVEVPPRCDHAQHPVAFESAQAGYDIAVCALCAFTIALALPAFAEAVVLSVIALPEPDVRSRLAPGAPLHVFNRGPPRPA